MHICLVNAGAEAVVGMTSKKIFRNQVDVAFTLHFFRKKFMPTSNTYEEFTEKVQAWKLFSDKKLYLE
jgi:hypothetical protein